MFLDMMGRELLQSCYSLLFQKEVKENGGRAERRISIITLSMLYAEVCRGGTYFGHLEEDI
jgi:hypothetical protein